MENIVIIGAGGFGREVKMLIDQINKVEIKFNFLGYYDDGVEKGTLVNGFKVLGGINDLNLHTEFLSVAIAIGLPGIKRIIIEKLTNPLLNFPKLIHPTVIIGDDLVIINEGVIICAGSVITCNIEIHKFVILNLMCSVGHDTIIQEYASFMPSVNISGEVLIGKEVYVGTGAKIINQLEIGDNTIIGAGAVVSKSLPSNCTAVGIPAKPIKFHQT
jgi:sugar O-acyltransferase (sialic acid O-acetyltransferase NeuD family)